MAFFQTKNPIWVNWKMLVYFVDSSSILKPFDIFVDIGQILL
jgi:hypothetical protein